MITVDPHVINAADMSVDVTTGSKNIIKICLDVSLYFFYNSSKIH